MLYGILASLLRQKEDKANFLFLSFLFGDELGVKILGVST